MIGVFNPPYEGDYVPRLELYMPSSMHALARLVEDSIAVL